MKYVITVLLFLSLYTLNALCAPEPKRLEKILPHYQRTGELKVKADKNNKPLEPSLKKYIEQREKAKLEAEIAELRRKLEAAQKDIEAEKEGPRRHTSS